MHSPVSFLDVVLKYYKVESHDAKIYNTYKEQSSSSTTTATIAKGLCTDYTFVQTELCYIHAREKNKSEYCYINKVVFISLAQENIVTKILKEVKEGGQN